MSFGEIKGQEGAVALLRRSLHEGKIATSYIFYGPPGVGKRSVALILAKSLNCEKGNDDSCNICLSCRKIGNWNHPDVRLVAPEKGRRGIGIEQIRGIEEETNLPAFEGRKRVFILEEAHTLSLEAANAFLKTLEEPPEDTLFILLTDKLYSLPVTILSRCQWIRFLPLNRELLGEMLHERKGIPAGKGELIAALCDGEVGRSLDFDEEAFFRNRALMVDLYFSASADEAIPMFEAVESILAGRGVGDVSLEGLLGILYSWCRDLLILSSGGDKRLVVNSDMMEQLHEEASRLRPPQAEELNMTVKEGLEMLERNVNKGMILVNLFLEMSHIRGKGEGGI